MKIGVFDSGIGGEAVAAALRREFIDAEIITASDTAHVPYGSRTSTEVIALTNAGIQPLLKARCDVILLACNTATAAAITHLRELYPSTPFVGLEPMIKPAAHLTRSGVIAVCATPATLNSERYQKLKNLYAKDLRVIEPDCSLWASLIEHGAPDRQSIEQTVEALCRGDADVIVLACTHYHWIERLIANAARGRAHVIQPTDAVALEIRRVYKSLIAAAN